MITLEDCTVSRLYPVPSRHRRGDRRRSRSLRHRPTVDLLEGRQLLASALTVTGVPISPAPVEGASFTAMVATFTDSDKNTDATQYSATIDWGDGTSSAATIAPDPKVAGQFDVTGTHTYKEEGPFRDVVQVTDKDGDTGMVKTTNIVADAALSATGVTLNARQNKPLKNVVVATFTDADPNGKPSDFTATIDWGDGHTSQGHVVRDPMGGFDVKGSHQYKAPGAFAVKVQIHDGGPGAVATQFYTPSNLVSDGTVPSDYTDTNLVNPWGLVASGGSPWWIADNGTGLSTLYNGIGAPQSLVVKIPGPMGSPADFTSAPTGAIFANKAGEFLLPPAKAGNPDVPSIFIFDTEDGTISGWNPGSNGGLNNAVLKVDNSTQVYPNGATGAVYKGLTLFTEPSGSTLPAGDYLVATNFRSGNLDFFDSGFKPVTLPAGAFQDPTLPAGYAPFGVQTINGNLFVTYALQTADKHDDVEGPGHGFVDEYNAAGMMIKRIGGTGVQPELNSPWGLTMAPATFGKFGGDLLVGNFGDSHVSAFDPTSGAFLGQLSDAKGQPLVLNGGFHGTDTKGLWALQFGNGAAAGSKNTLFFTAGINDEQNGLFGSLTATSLSTATASTVVSVTPKGHGHHEGDDSGDDNAQGDEPSEIAAITPDDSGSGDKHDHRHG
jgi:uncharacterized protein (TIGR03118 family)